MFCANACAGLCFDQSSSVEADLAFGQTLDEVDDAEDQEGEGAADSDYGVLLAQVFSRPGTR